MFTLGSPLALTNQSTVTKKRELFHKARAFEEK